MDMDVDINMDMNIWKRRTDGYGQGREVGRYGGGWTWTWY